jgi:hypothetical protein
LQRPRQVVVSQYALAVRDRLCELLLQRAHEGALELIVLDEQRARRLGHDENKRILRR